MAETDRQTDRQKVLLYHGERRGDGKRKGGGRERGKEGEKEMPLSHVCAQIRGLICKNWSRKKPNNSKLLKT